MNLQEQNQSLQELDAQQRAEFVPKQYFEVISNRVSDNSMPPALIFSADNLTSIKRYVHYVLRLPRSVEEITGSHNLALIGLDAQQVHRLYTNLRSHADQWDVLERQSKHLGISLDLFALTFVEEGDRLIQQLQSTEAYSSLKNRLGDVIDEVTLKSTGFKALGEADREQVSSLREYLEFLKKDVALVLRLIDELKERAQWFTDALVKQLRPEADALMGHIREVDAEKTIADLREQVRLLDKDIAVNDAAYKKLVGYAFTGLAFGPLGVAITGGIYGSKAEGVRAANKRLKRQREVLVKDIASINPMLAIFETTSAQIADLAFRLIEVQTAAKNLEDVWNMLGVYVEQSSEELDLINDDIQLAIFVIRFERVIRPWSSIRDISAQLSKLFNETVSEISKEGASS